MDRLNWVTAVSECSLTKTFESLRLQVKEDIEEREELRAEKEDNHYAFRMVSGGRSFTVLVEGAHPIKGSSVVFSQNADAISVSDDKDTLLFHAIPTVNDERKCILRINGKDCELWQASRMALEKLFFTRY